MSQPAKHLHCDCYDQLQWHPRLQPIDPPLPKMDRATTSSKLVWPSPSDYRCMSVNPHHGDGPQSGSDYHVRWGGGRRIKIGWCGLERYSRYAKKKVLVLEILGSCVAALASISAVSDSDSSEWFMWYMWWDQHCKPHMQTQSSLLISPSVRCHTSLKDTGVAEQRDSSRLLRGTNPWALEPAEEDEVADLITGVSQSWRSQSVRWTTRLWN